MNLIWARINTLLLLLLLFALVGVLAMLAARSEGGPLDPGTAPGPTGVTIEEAGSWSRQLSGTGGCNSARYKCVMPTAAQPTGDAILDRETGLVWQRAAGSVEYFYFSAVDICATALTGDRYGWRLPTHAELRTTLFSPPAGVPPGMPILPGGVADREYWTASLTTFGTEPEEQLWVYVVDYDEHEANAQRIDLDLTTNGVWCVRGADPGGGL
jgi:hypothetical protein